MKGKIYDGEECLSLFLLVLFFVFCSIWFEFYSQITIDVILVHIWILEYIFLFMFTFLFFNFFIVINFECLGITCEST